MIAHDGSTCADDALNDLPRAGLPRNADALIVNVRERWLKPPNSETDAALLMTINSAAVKPMREIEESQSNVNAEQTTNLEQAARRLGSYFPEWKIKTLALAGSPAPVIIAQAAKWNAALLIVGSHGCTESRRFMLGSVSQKVVNEAACSVRVVRGQAWKNGSPSRLLIGLDNSGGAMAAVAEVAARMWTMGSEVRLVFACDPAEKQSPRLVDYLADIRQILERAELTVTESLETADPKQIIVAAAEEWGADCIFLGANDAANSAENHLLGSVATAIVARANCTVEIVRPTKVRLENA